MNLFMPPVTVGPGIESLFDTDVVAEARSAREAAEAAESEASPSRWREADAYAELSRRGWSLRRIADECGTNKDTVSRFVRCVERIGTDTRPSFWAVYAQLTGENVRVARNSGEEHWYTPPQIIQAARAVLGEIDLDPATSLRAQETVRARHYYTAAEDGLSKHWEGRVWLNPPYCVEKVRRFTAKLCQHFTAGDVPAALLLTNNATETAWFQETAERASAICLPAGRVRFLDEAGKPSGSPLQGQAVLYFGADLPRFAEAFSQFGLARGLHELGTRTCTGRDRQPAAGPARSPAVRQG
jgi:ParB family chromosome partitioning protein